MPEAAQQDPRSPLPRSSPRSSTRPSRNRSVTGRSRRLTAYKADGRRRASYFYRVPEHAGRGRASRDQAELFESQPGEEVELEIVNAIRGRVKDWRAGVHSGGVAYDGASPVTRELLDLWRSDQPEDGLE